MAEHPPLQWPKPSDSKPPLCLTCGYRLDELNVPRCPECGRSFDPRDPRTYSTKPPFIGWKFWLPGLTTAIVGALLIAIVLLQRGNWGWALWGAAPFAGGAILGYRVRSRWFVMVALILIMAAGLALGMMSLNIAGVYCGMALAGIFLGPVTVGVICGSTVRIALKMTPFSQRSHLPTIAFLSVPLICGLIEGRPTPVPPETVSTSMTIDQNIDACWNSIMFYEEVQHEPPWILKVGLARPLYTVGRCSAVNDRKVCIYNKGHITKRVSKLEEPTLLAFDVLEQQIGYERDVRLISGSFRFRAISADQTAVTLETTYEPLLRPRWVWRPFEQHAVHTLHHHVLEGMRLEAARHAQHAALEATSRHARAH